MAKGKSGSVAASVQTMEKPKVDKTFCGLQFDSDEERKGHEERHSCCNYRLYSHYQGRQT